MANILQWVNFERKQLFVEDEVKSLERVGPVHFQVTFAKATAAKFKVRVTPVNEPQKYTASELNRNQNFKIRHARTQTNSGKSNVKIEEDVFLPAAGGNSYKLEAKYKKTVKDSKVVETRRKIYYQAIHMDGISVPAIGPTVAYYEKLFLVIKNKGADGNIPFKTIVRSDDWTSGGLALIREAAAKYTIDQYHPWAFAVVFVNMIASRQEKEYLPTAPDAATFAVGARIFNWGTQTITFVLPSNDYLWWGLEPKDDSANGGKGEWLVTNSCQFIESGGAVHNIPDANISIDLSVKRTALGGHNTLKIEIPANIPDRWRGKTGKIQIKLRVVKGFSGGYSQNVINIITVAKRGWWNENSDDERLQTLNHEMGHKYGMVPQGIGNSLDAGAHLYGGSTPGANQKGHLGPHCENGSPVYAVHTPGQPPDWIGTPTCVMFGASPYVTAAGTYHVTPSQFCGDCEPQVKKLDLDGRGLPGFANSITTM